MQAIRRFFDRTQVDWEHSEVLGWFYICVGIGFMLLLAGVLYGWSSLLVVLYASGVYAELCSSNSTTNASVALVTNEWIHTISQSISPRVSLMRQVEQWKISASTSAPVSNGSSALCIEQELRLNLAYVAGIATFMCAGPLTGFLMDWRGSRFSVGVWSTFALLGVLLFAFGSNTVVFDAVIPATVLMGLGTSGILISAYSLTKMKPKYVSMVFAFLSIAFDSSTSVFYAYMMIWEATKLPLKTFFLIYSSVPLLGILWSLFFWPRGVGEPLHHSNSKEKFADSELDFQAKDPEDPPEQSGDSNGKENSKHSKSTTSEESTEVATEDPSQEDQSANSEDSNQSELSSTLEEALSSQMSENFDAEHTAQENQSSKEVSEDLQHLKFGSTHLFGLPFLSQVKSFEWIFYTIYFTLYTFWLNAYFGSVQSRLQYFDPTKQNSGLILTMVEVLGICLSAAFVFAPIVGLVIQKIGLEWSIFVLAVIGTAWSVLQFVPIILAQISTFILFAIFRAYFYSITMNLLSQLIGWTHIGKAYGLAGLVAGLISFLYPPLVSEVYRDWGGSFTIPTILETISISFGFAFWLYLRWRRISYLRKHTLSQPLDDDSSHTIEITKTKKNQLNQMDDKNIPNGHGTAKTSGDNNMEV